MVSVTERDLEDFPLPPAERQALVEYLSSDSDEDESETLKKLEAFEPLVQLDDRFPSTVVLVGVPVVEPERLEKLECVLRSKIGEELIRRGGEEDEDFEVEIPMNSKGTLTTGCCFFTFASSHAAQHAVRTLNKYKIDRKHCLRAAMLDDFDEIMKRDESYNPPIPLRGFTREDLRWWLLDPRLREQFVIRHANETEVFWLDPMEKEACSLCYDGHRERQEGRAYLTEQRVAWSPQGSFLTSFHKQGIALWGGPNFEKKVRMEHREVKQILFSPRETYVITWDGTPSSMRSEKSVKIWNVMTGELLRQFPTPAASPRGTEFPHFLFSHDERYIGKIGNKEFCVYAMDPKDCGGEGVDQDPSPVKLLRDESGHHSALKYPVEKFEWSPADNIAAIWIRGTEDAPGRLVLVEIPSRRELASKNVYNVKGAAMHWQGCGDFLCLRTVVVKKTGKKGRKEFTQLEIFRMREKDIPVDNIRLNDLALQLHWEEGAGKRFVLIVQEEGTNQQSLKFFRVVDADESNVESGKRDTVMTHSLDIPDFMNFFRWAPFGASFIVAALNAGGALMFCQLNEQDRVEVLHQGQHYSCNEARWSDCGRYLATSAVVPLVGPCPSYRLDDDTGFCLWTFQGKLIEKCKKKLFHQFLWRPHPPSLLSDKQIENVKKRIKEYSKRYETEDERMRAEKREEYLRQRKERLDAFQEIMEELNNWKNQNPLAAEWAACQEAFDAMFEWEVEETVTEQELDVQQEVFS